MRSAPLDDDDFDAPPRKAGQRPNGQRMREQSLREISAREFDEPPRQSARTVGGASAKGARARKAGPSMLRRALARLARRPAKNLFLGVFASAVVGILVNALALQKERHPAPIFASPSQVEKDREALRQISAAPAVPVPLPRPAAAPQPDAVPAALPARAEKQREVTGSADARIESRAKDPIAQLIKTGLVTPSAAPSPVQEAKAAAPPQPNAQVLAAQRALVKLGYVLKADGVAGPTTKQAVEIFERERKLPVKGELSPKVMKEIMAAVE